MDIKPILDKDVKDPEALSRQAAKDRIQQLREAVEHHDYLYYVKNDPEISDRAYDTLFVRLKELEDAWPDFQSKDSPTQKVGAPPLDSLKKREHTAPMLSLDAVTQEAEVARFLDRLSDHFSSGKNRYVLEPKFDGLSVELVFRDGSFQYGTTRGDGGTGEDITENLKTIGAMPLRLRKKEKPPSFLAVRAEVIMPLAGFQVLNKKRIQNGEEPFSNPRNAAAGIVRQLDPSMVRDKPLTLFVYELLAMEGRAPDTHWDLLEKLPEWGLRVSDRNEKTGSLDDVKQYHRKMMESRDALGFEIDGVVVKVNDYRVREKLGTRRRSPRWAIAWKFEQKKEITRLTDIVVQVGRTGKLTPVALLEPVDVGGVTVSRSTLHNADEVHKKDVRPGDKVRIQRAGDVIPEVVERVREKGRAGSEPFAMPRKCPVCGSAVFQEGAYHFCPGGLSCAAQLERTLVHYGSRQAMDITHLGEKTVKALVEKKMVTDMAGLYELGVEEIRRLEGFAGKSARQLHDAIQGAKKAGLDRFLYALGIRHVGEHIATVLARSFGSLENLRKASADRLREIPEIGPQIADSVSGFFDDDTNRKVLERLFEQGVTVTEMTADRTGALEGLTFVFTGKLEHDTRSQAREKVEARGGRTASSISGQTDFLVKGKDPGSKLDEAKKEDGIRIVHEQAFREILEKGP
jgi:DNA ligase (NAD+)